MDFYIQEKPTLVKRNGMYYPTYRIDIDGDIIAAELENLDINPEEMAALISECEPYISYAISKEISRRAYSMYPPETKTGTCVSAEVSHCTWSGDELFEGESDYVEDISVVLDKVPLARLPLPMNIGQACSDGDMDFVYEDGVDCGLFAQWDGPYNVYIDEYDYRRYYDIRKTIEK